MTFTVSANYPWKKKRLEKSWPPPTLTQINTQTHKQRRSNDAPPTRRCLSLIVTLGWWSNLSGINYLSIYPVSSPDPPYTSNKLTWPGLEWVPQQDRPVDLWVEEVLKAAVMTAGHQWVESDLWCQRESTRAVCSGMWLAEPAPNTVNNDGGKTSPTLLAEAFLLVYKGREQADDQEQRKVQEQVAERKGLWRSLATYTTWVGIWRH